MNSPISAVTMPTLEGVAAANLGDLGVLPRESFVPFAVHRLARPRALYVDDASFSEAAMLENYAFAIRQDGEGAFTTESKTAWGERYGGEGLTYNGGGVRCGVFDGVQIKGIGPNPLAGEGTQFWYSHGGCSREEALVELVWGEVLSRVLPHGAVRALGVIDTGSSCFIRGETDEIRLETPRALLLREAALRPAHFERAVAFRPTRTLRRSQVSDAERTRCAISQFANALPRARSVDAGVWSGLVDVVRIGLGLEELALRLAEQLARARARRFMHGAYTSSNVGLDGRFIDFSTTSALSCHANVVLGINEPFWKDEKHFTQVLRNLVHYAAKYLPEDRARHLPAPQLIERAFKTRLSACLVFEFASLSGLVDADGPEGLSPEQVALGIESIRIVSADAARPLEGIPDERYRVGPALGEAFTMLSCTPPEQWEACLVEHVERSDARRALTSRYETARAAFLQAGEKPMRERLVRSRAQRAAKTHPLLYRHRLLESLRALDARHPELEEFRGKFARFSRRLLNEIEVLHGPDEAAQPLYVGDAGRLRWEIATGDFIAEARNGQAVRLSRRELFESTEAGLMANRARAFWGPVAWENFR